MFTGSGAWSIGGQNGRTMATSRKTVIATVALTWALGCIPPWLAASGLLPHGPASSDQAPVWLAWIFGLVFFLAGLAVIVKTLAGGDLDAGGGLPLTAPRAVRAAYDVIVTAIVVSLATLFSWVAFGAGARHFSVYAEGGVNSVSLDGSGEMSGRVAFGLAAILGWVIVCSVMVSIARRWFPRR